MVLLSLFAPLVLRFFSSKYQRYQQIFFQKVDFVKRLTNRYLTNIACSVESYTFASELEFQNFKEKKEVENLVYFSKQRGNRCGKKFQYVYYNCQRDGAQCIHRAHDKKDCLTESAP